MTLRCTEVLIAVPVYILVLHPRQEQKGLSAWSAVDHTDRQVCATQQLKCVLGR